MLNLALVNIYIPLYYAFDSHLYKRDKLTEINQDIEPFTLRFSSISISQDALESQRKSIKPKEDIKVSQCTVCLEDIGNQDAVLTTPCGHVHHTKCIMKWLKTSHVCPLCRSQLRLP